MKIQTLSHRSAAALILCGLLASTILSGCYTARRIATKPVRVLEHGGRKLEKHL